MSSTMSTHCGEPPRAWTPLGPSGGGSPLGTGMSCEPVRMAIFWFMDGLRLILASELWLREPGFPL